jgi:hypothetical protein
VSPFGAVSFPVTGIEVSVARKNDKQAAQWTSTLQSRNSLLHPQASHERAVFDHQSFH